VRLDQQRLGERNGRAKLTGEDIDEIWAAVRQRDKLRAEAKRLREEARRLDKAAMALSNTALARNRDVTETTIRNILQRQLWTHIQTKVSSGCDSVAAASARTTPSRHPDYGKSSPALMRDLELLLTRPDGRG